MKYRPKVIKSKIQADRLACKKKKKQCIFSLLKCKGKSSKRCGRIRRSCWHHAKRCRFRVTLPSIKKIQRFEQKTGIPVTKRFIKRLVDAKCGRARARCQWIRKRCPAGKHQKRCKRRRRRCRNRAHRCKFRIHYRTAQNKQSQKAYCKSWNDKCRKVTVFCLHKRSLVCKRMTKNCSITAKRCRFSAQPPQSIALYRSWWNVVCPHYRTECRWFTEHCRAGRAGRHCRSFAGKCRFWSTQCQFHLVPVQYKKRATTSKKKFCRQWAKRCELANRCCKKGRRGARCRYRKRTCRRYQSQCGFKMARQQKRHMVSKILRPVCRRNRYRCLDIVKKCYDKATPKCEKQLRRCHTINNACLFQYVTRPYIQLVVESARAVSADAKSIYRTLDNMVIQADVQFPLIFGVLRYLPLKILKMVINKRRHFVRKLTRRCRRILGPKLGKRFTVVDSFYNANWIVLTYKNQSQIGEMNMFDSIRAVNFTKQPKSATIPSAS